MAEQLKNRPNASMPEELFTEDMSEPQKVAKSKNSSIFEKESRIQAITAVAQSVLAIASLVSSIVIGLYVWYGQSEMTKRQIEKSTRDSWIAVDLAALENDSTLVAADNLMDPKNVNDPIEKRRKRWFGYAIMNIIIERYDAAQQGLIGPKEDAINSCKELLRPLMLDDDIYEITQGHGYETRIKVLCKEIRNEVINQQGVK